MRDYSLLQAPVAGLAVTVVGIYYAPDSTGIAPYTTDLCEMLADLGADVNAVVGVPHYPQWKAPSGYRIRPVYREVRCGVRVTRVRHFVPRSQDVVRRGLYELTFLVGSRLATRRFRSSVVLGVTPSLAGAATASALAGRLRVPLGLVVQDLVGLAAEQTGIRGGARLAQRIGQLEGRILRRADRLAVITDAFVAPLLASGIERDRIDLLPNHVRLSPAATSTAAARERLGWPVEARIAVRTGNMGLKQDLGTVVEVARLAAERRSDLRIILIGDGSTRRDLQRQAGGLRNIRFLDPLPLDRYPFALAAADCLLLNERASVSTMSMPSKLTSYFAAGRPVVAATQPGGAAASEIRRSGAGTVVPPGRPAELLAAIEHVVDNPSLAALRGEAGRRYAARELTREAAQHRLVRFVESVAAARLPAAKEVS
jgi:colanic acid biosynthesis glycosyl transferase WcaI